MLGNGIQGVNPGAEVGAVKRCALRTKGQITHLVEAFKPPRGSCNHGNLRLDAPREVAHRGVRRRGFEDQSLRLPSVCGRHPGRDSAAALFPGLGHGRAQFSRTDEGDGRQGGGKGEISGHGD